MVRGSLRVVPITLSSTAWLPISIIYNIALFTLGCASTMRGYGYYEVGRFSRWASEQGKRIYRTLVVMTSASGLILGMVWILKNV